ncbi:MAG: PAS domain S-box protein [Xanthomonadales bacterium]|nr:PAS domain S-box protein [Gammaproteobacteria bacterium]MBT8052772.1 PAS domain S-box protein [Gammaproteobacteria bacterium]NND56165.1 PAS domain S-box protein [Xanthomonadales bacterium]NNK50570.1 PAS domain S-box protein [Xanthomonadales bacterium]
MTTSRIQDAANAFDALMDAAVDAIIIIDSQGLVRRFNRAAEQMFGYREKDIRGKNVNLLMPEPDHSSHDRYLSQYGRTGDKNIIGKGREVRGRKQDGGTFPMFLSVGEIRQKEGNRYVGIIKDLSEVRESQQQVRQLEEQLLHADRLVILGELTAGIAHEINQPLTAIAAYADAGRKITDRQNETPPDEINTVCERISEQSRRAAEVVQRLRKLVQSGEVSKARHDINQIIRNTLLLFEYEVKRYNVELFSHPIKALQPLYIDEIHIQQILVNLVKNSLDAISLAGQQDGRIDIRIKKAGPDVLISVTDNGPGVPLKHRERLFESFFTTKPKGVGLGLSICKTIAGAHGGSLKYSQPKEGGSRFTLSLPLEFIG